MKALKSILGSSVLLGAIFFSQNALADGVLLAPSALSNADRAKLTSQVQADRAGNPAAYKAVRSVKGHRPEVYRNFRNPYPTTSREFRGMGAPGLLAMLDALALDAPTRGSLTDAEWDALAIGMLEAVGMLRDVRARPVLLAAFEASARPEVLNAVARALGRLGGDPELAMLTKHAKKGDSLMLAAIHGLGQLRRVEAAKHLASLLASTTDEAVAEEIANALGTTGSSWAWKAFGAKYATQALEVRKVCAQALASGFVRVKGTAARNAISEGILMVEHPETVDYLKAARPASGATAKAVDALIVKVEKVRARQKR
jgi:hypothetical protein